MTMVNLVLVGFMGTGKTTVGIKLARKFDMKFVDTDHEIEHATGMSVNDIFEKYSEVRFRSEEKAAVRRVTREQGQVIATGGGVVLDPENMEMLKQNGVIVCLAARPEVIYHRVKRRKTRPLLQTENPLQTITELLSLRIPFYALADYTVDTSDLLLDEVTVQVSKIYQEHSS